MIIFIIIWYEYAVIGIARGLKWYVYIDYCGIMYVWRIVMCKLRWWF